MTGVGNAMLVVKHPFHCTGMQVVEVVVVFTLGEVDVPVAVAAVVIVVVAVVLVVVTIVVVTVELVAIVVVAVVFVAV